VENLSSNFWIIPLYLLSNLSFLFNLVCTPCTPLLEKKKKRYGKCNTIVIGLFAGKENAFLIQNAFPVIEKYFDHIHTIQEQPVTIHKKLDKLLVENLNDEIT